MSLRVQDDLEEIQFKNGATSVSIASEQMLIIRFFPSKMQTERCSAMDPGVKSKRLDSEITNGKS